MNMDELNKKYAQLCQELGHLVTNGKRITARIVELETEINEVDRQASLLKLKAQEDAAKSQTKKEA